MALAFGFVNLLIGNVLSKRLISREFARDHSMVYKYANPERVFVGYFPINKKSTLSILCVDKASFHAHFPNIETC
jgi:hypothetical protein